MQRSALSIPANIAEGCERDTTPDFIRFLRISKGSCGELRTQLYVLERVRKRLEQAPIDGSRAMIAETKELSKMIQGLINSLKRRPQKPLSRSPGSPPLANPSSSDH
jgi:four helix bundle protein